jgi:hypothetical protein
VVLCSALLTAGAAPARAQVVKGRLLDSTTKQPILLATVLLLDTAMSPLDRTFTDEKGGFVLSAPRPGDYYIGAERTGYKTKIDGILQLGEGGSITVDFFLVPQPVGLDTVPVAVSRERASQHLEAVGFLERRRQGSAWTLGPEEIEKRVVNEVAQLFRGAPGVRIVDTGAGSGILFRGGSVTVQRATDSQGWCIPRVLIDGSELPAFRGGDVATAGVVLDGAVNVDDIIAVEVHSGPASLPLIYAGTSTSCTTVLIWTSRA